MGAVAFLVSDINLAMWEVAVCGAIRVSQLRNGAFLPVLNPSKNRARAVYRCPWSAHDWHQEIAGSGSSASLA